MGRVVEPGPPVVPWRPVNEVEELSRYRARDARVYDLIRRQAHARKGSVNEVMATTMGSLIKERDAAEEELTAVMKIAAMHHYPAQTDLVRDGWDHPITRCGCGTFECEYLAILEGIHVPVHP